ncbi:MAG: AMP-binding protein, partial [Bdellovibrionales bacterium]|nr:AMP-binding protein [Bdellovibrionales bacterium]
SAPMNDPDAVMRCVCGVRATCLVCRPELLEQLSSYAESEQLSGLRFVAVGGNRLTPRQRQAFEEKFDVPLLEGYGAAEVAGAAIVQVPALRGRSHEKQMAKKGTVGQPIPGVCARIVGETVDEVLPSGAVGELCLAGPTVMLGYLDDPALEKQTLIEGWFRTGDRAAIDEEGHVVLEPDSM